MKGATHFIEQYKDLRTNRSLKSPQPMEISKLSSVLKYSKENGFITVAVFYIKPKPSVILARHDQEISATIIEKPELLNSLPCSTT